MGSLLPSTPDIPETPIVPPVAPIEDTSVEMGGDKSKKKNTGKSSLKIPLVDTSESGLRI